MKHGPSPLEIACVAVPERPEAGVLERAAAVLPERMRAEVARYRRAEDRAAVLCGRLLLRAMGARLGCGAVLESFRRDARGRPAADAPFDFNVAHTRGLAVCAAGAGMRVGIDVERAAPVDLAQYESVLTAEELRAVRAAPDPARAFYRLWTIKESILKADGIGLGAAPDEVAVEDASGLLRGRRWWFREPDLAAGYACAVAYDRPEVRVSVRAVRFEELTAFAPAGFRFRSARRAQNVLPPGWLSSSQSSDRRSSS